LDIDLDGPVRKLFEQSDGTLWIGGLWDLYRYRDGDLIRIDDVETYGLTGPEAIMETSNGDLWVAFLAGVWQLKEGKWKRLPDGRQTGFEGTTTMFESGHGLVGQSDRGCDSHRRKNLDTVWREERFAQLLGVGRDGGC
jgi:ligand-binding sensor domain-containing protein